MSLVLSLYWTIVTPILFGQMGQYYWSRDKPPLRASSTTQHRSRPLRIAGVESVTRYRDRSRGIWMFISGFVSYAKGVVTGSTNLRLNTILEGLR